MKAANNASHKKTHSDFMKFLLDIGAQVIIKPGTFITSSQKNFERKIFNSIGDVFSFFWNCPYSQTFGVCRVLNVLYNTSVGCHCGSEAGDGGFESPYRPYSERLFRYSLYVFIF